MTTLGRQAIAGFVILGLVALVCWFVLIKPGQDRRRAAEAEAAAVVAAGQAAAGKDAVGVITNQTAKERDSASLDARNEAAIRAGGPDAGRRALCLRDANRNQPACVELRNAHP